MNEQRLFRRRHPLIFGMLIFIAICVLFWGGITVLVATLTRSSGEKFFASEDSIGVVELKGVIVSAEKVIEQLSDFRRDDTIKAVLVRIDSPGGAVGASQEIFTEIKRTDAVKPVVVSMGSVAASGGFYAAMGARRIVASPGTITGSIGVIIKFPNLKGLFDKIGYHNQVVKSGPLKDVGSPERDLTEAERDMLQEVITGVYNQFVADVAQSRKLPEDKVREVADGRIFSGERAKAMGLIDQLGNFTDAVTVAATLAGMEDKTPPLVYPQEDSFSLLHLLTGESTGATLRQVLQTTPGLAYLWDIAQ